MHNCRKLAVTRIAVAALFCAVCTLSPRTILAQFIQRIAREERLPARREAQTFRRVTRAQDSAFRQAARRDEQLGRRSAWARETHFRGERRRVHREKIKRTRAQEQVIRTDRANFNIAQTKQRQAVHQNTAQQRREQTLRISREIRQTNIEKQRANRQRIEEVRDTIRSELQHIRQGTRPTSR